MNGSDAGSEGQQHCGGGPKMEGKLEFAIGAEYRISDHSHHAGRVVNSPSRIEFIPIASGRD
jgi:hypothetical protein